MRLDFVRMSLRSISRDDSARPRFQWANRNGRVLIDRKLSKKSLDLIKRYRIDCLQVVGHAAILAPVGASFLRH